MLNRTLESYSIAHDPDFIPHELLHLAHQLFESGVDGPIRVSYARLAPGLGWTMAKFVAHFPAGPGTKDQTLEKGITCQALCTMHTRNHGLARFIYRSQTCAALQLRSHVVHCIECCWAVG